MRIDIITALPDIVRQSLDITVLRRAKNAVDVRVHDLRAYAAGRHRQIDDYAYGGAAGMVLKPEPIFGCIESLQAESEKDVEPIDEVVFLSPDGEAFNQSTANALSLKQRIVLLAGHYKGVDQRVRDSLVTLEISMGDYVLSGGELPALVLIATPSSVLCPACSAMRHRRCPIRSRTGCWESLYTPDRHGSGE